MSAARSRRAEVERWLWEHAGDWIGGTAGAETLATLAAAREEDVPKDLIAYLGPDLVFRKAGWPSRAALQSSANEIAHEKEQRAAALRVSALLDAAAVPHVFFKGADFRYRLYPEPHRRGSCDVDFLVPVGVSGRAVEALRRSGVSLRESPDGVIAGTYHELSADLDGVALDLHTSPVQPGRTAFRAEDVALRAETVDVEGGRLRVPCREDSIAIALVHMGAHEGSSEFVEFRHGLDLVLAFARWPDVDGRDVAERARAWRCRRLAGAGLWSWKPLLGARIPQAFLDALDPGPLQRGAAMRSRRVLGDSSAPSGLRRLSQLGRKLLFAEGGRERLWLLRELARRVGPRRP